MRVRQPLNADERALLELLLRDVGPRLFAYVRRAFGTWVDAEEIVAETFARAADNITAVRGCERKDLYLFTVARNLCRDAFRRRRPNTLPDGRLRDHPAATASPEESFADREARRRLLAAVATLPQPQREVVVLRLSAELRFEQIAELLQIPLGTALSRMNAALGHLRKELGYVHACRKA
ncbi:MAG: RNA polymerase sigma factor [Phycisphaerae bacterium]